MKPVTTEDVAGARVGGNESPPVGLLPAVCRSMTPAATVPLLACTRKATRGASGVKSDSRRVSVVCGAITMPLVLGGLIGPLSDQKLNATLAGASAGLASTSTSWTPTPPSAPANHQSVAGARQVRSNMARPSPKGINDVWLATTPSAPAPVTSTVTAPKGVALRTTADGLRGSRTACLALPVADTGAYAATGAAPEVTWATVMSVVRPPGPPDTDGQTS